MPLGMTYLTGLGPGLPEVVGCNMGISNDHLSCWQLRLVHSIWCPSRFQWLRVQDCRHPLLRLGDRQLLGLPLLGVANGSMVLVVACLLLLPQVLGHR